MHNELANIALHNFAARTYIGFKTNSNANEENVTMTFKQSFRNWRQYRNTCNELYRMTDRELGDIGISRSEIPFVARQAVR
ncbi:MAG: hypothetical protein MnENMB40S_16540 [Rhizobiaceae bacterium MnEN-MB40S]|jgi:uncharacterized protein YjiS (DUF1127 family)|nr:MAG: hypothetical protein MnENMB40S_16540 [Rhizobiaceae bacterium MnEN-MB40S]